MEKVEQSIDDSKEVLTLGGKPEESTVSLRIFGDDLDPDELTQLLNCQPTKAYRKGHVVTTTMSPRTVRTGQWFLSVEKNRLQTLEEQIAELFEKLPDDLEIWKKVNKRFHASIYCGAWLKGWNRDVWFSAELLKKMADRELLIGLAIYCDCEEDKE